MPTKTWNEFRKFQNIGSEDRDNFWGVVRDNCWIDSAHEWGAAYTLAIDGAELPLPIRDAAIGLSYLHAKEFMRQLGLELLHGHELRMRYVEGALQ